MSLRLSSQSRTSGSSSKSCSRRILPLTLGQITGQAGRRSPIATRAPDCPSHGAFDQRYISRPRAPGGRAQPTQRRCILGSAPHGPSSAVGAASLTRVRSVAGLAIRWPHRVLARTLALLTRSRGAKRGANDHRHGATPGHIQPLSLQSDGTLGHTRQRPATFGKCLLSSRSRVRVAVGAQIRQANVDIRNLDRSIDVLLAGNHST